MTDTPPPASKKPQKVVVLRNWPLRRALAGFFAILMLLPAILITTVPLLLASGGDTANISITGGVLSTVVAELLVILWALYYTGQLKKWRQALGLINFTWKRFLGGFGVGVLLLIGLQVFATLVGQIFGSPVESSDTSNSLASLPGVEKYIVLLLVVPFIVPFVEEVFFRGYVFRFIANGNLKGKTGPLLGIFLSAFFFAALHFQGFNSATDVFLVVWIFIVGAVNALLVWKTDSVFTSYGSHLAYNLGTVLLILFAGSL